MQHRDNYYKNLNAILHRGYHSGSFSSADTELLAKWTLPLNASSISNLDQSMTINGQTETPVFVYEGKNAVPATYTATVGENLSQTGGGYNPIVDQPTPFLDATDKSTFHNRDAGGVKGWDADGSAFANVTTEDIVIEIISYGSTATHYAVKKYASAGWFLSIQSSALKFGIDTGPTLKLTTAPYTNDVWNHTIFFCDRSAFCRGYTNSIPGVAVDVSDAAASISSSDLLTLGRPTATSGFYRLAYVAMWKKDNWLDSGLQQAVASERFARLCGVYPTLATGVATPSNQVRDTVASLHKYDEANSKRQIFQVGENWPRVCSERNAADDATIKGYLGEDEATELIIETNDISTYTATNCTPTQNVDSPEPEEQGWTLDEETATGAHSVLSDAVSMTSGDFYVVSCFLKDTGSVTRAQLSLTGGAVVTVDVNISTGAIVSDGGTWTVTSSHIEDWGDDWYRVWANITAGATGSYGALLSLQDDSGNLSYEGTDRTIGVFGFNICEVSTVYEPVSSYIKASGATATRNHDELGYATTDNMNETTGELTMKVFSNDMGTFYSDKAFVSLDDGTTVDQIVLSTQTQEKVEVEVRNTSIIQANIAHETDIEDGVQHTLKTTWKSNAFTLLVDDVEAPGSPDTSGVPPTGLTTINVGNNEAQASHSRYLISELEIKG